MRIEHDCLWPSLRAVLTRHPWTTRVGSEIESWQVWLGPELPREAKWAHVCDKSRHWIRGPEQVILLRGLSCKYCFEIISLSQFNLLYLL